jgi:SAM-dependent methyltransferase
MGFNLKGFLYRIFIDPMLSGIRIGVTGNISRDNRIIDIACGTGTLAIAMAKTGKSVTGFDFDKELISYASRRITGKNINNVQFRIQDASDMSAYHDKEFDVAVTTMAVHQFEPDLAIKIIGEMKRVASKVIIADYNHPMPYSLFRSLAFGIEKSAGGDHYCNFRNYIASGGIKYFTDAAGLTIRSSETRGNGVFVVVVCE